MEPTMDAKMLSEKLTARFKELPQALQTAILSTDIEKKLRELSEVHKLHLDQWQGLENEVMLALLGFQPGENLGENIKNAIGISDEDAQALAEDISDAIFKPIRTDLERALGKPLTDTEDDTLPAAEPADKFAAGLPAEASAQAGSPQPVEDKPVASSLQPVARNSNQVPSIQDTEYKIQNTVSAPLPIPSTPPAPAPAQKSVRAILSPAYASDTKSHERKTIDDDPYREAIK